MNLKDKERYHIILIGMNLHHTKDPQKARFILGKKCTNLVEELLEIH